MIKLVLKYFLITSLVILLLLYGSIEYYKSHKLARVSSDTSYIYKNSPVLLRQVVLFGDSRVKSWNPKPIIGDFTVLNRGVAAETTPQMMLRFEQDVLALQPDILIIQAGINDMVIASMADTSLEVKMRSQQCVDNLRTMVDLATAKGINVTLLSIAEPYKLGIIRSVLWGGNLTELVQEANRQLLSTHSNFMVDTNNLLTQTNDVKKDALHFTHKAYGVLNNAIYSHIQSHS